MDRIGREKMVVELMIRLYCRRQEKNRTLCGGCRALLEYARQRLDRCRYGVDKPACKRCPTHCYAPHYREQIRRVMRFSGPWMPLYHPLETMRRVLTGFGRWIALRRFLERIQRRLEK